MSVGLVFLRSRTPAVEKQKINGCRTSAPAVPHSRSGLKNEEYTHFSFVSLCKYLSTAGLREQNINVTQSWLGILESSLETL